MGLMIASIDIHQNNDGMYCLNDLHRAAINQGFATDSHRPSNFIKSQSEFIAAAKATGVALKTVKGGNAPGVWAIELVAMKYAGWISPSYEVQVYQIAQAYKKGQLSQDTAPKLGITEAAGFVEIVSRSMNISNSGRLGMFKEIERLYGLPSLIPNYAIDAPSDAVDGSSRPTKSLTQILKESGAGITAKFAYVALQQAGIVERKSRPSSKGGDKEFWAVTVKGLLYGKNITSPNNQRETQPHFYESRAAELVTIITNTISGE